MNKLISFSFKKIYYLIIILGIIDSICFIVPHEIDDKFESKHHKRRKYSFIIQTSSFLSSIFCLIPYLYIRYKTKNNLKDKRKKEILNQLDKRLKYILEKLKMFKEKKLEIFIIIISISFINFFCHAQYLKKDFFKKNLYIFEYNYHEFYFISFFILFKFFFNFTFYNLYKLCLIISIFSSLLTLISLSYIKKDNNNIFDNLYLLFLIIIFRFLMSFVYCCYKYLMIYYFLNGYFIIFIVGCLSSFLYFFYMFFCKENFFYFEDKIVYLYLFINFINNFIHQILLIKLIDKLNPLYYCLTNFISSLIKILYHVIFTKEKLKKVYFRLIINIINIINGLIYCEIIQINICNLNYYCRIELEKIAKEEQKDFDNNDSTLISLNKI